MPDFDKPRFEQLMGEAVALHNDHQYASALVLSTRAYKMAPDNSFEAGRAARDNSARYDRLGVADSALVWATTAYEIHDTILSGMEHPSREAFRERSMSAMYVGVNGLRKAVKARRSFTDSTVADYTADSYMQRTWGDLKEAKAQAEGINRMVDQYEINASRRVSMTESLLGDRLKGLAIGVRAVGLAFMSESPRLDTSEPQLTTKQRLQAKAKAFAGGVAAIGVGILASPRRNYRQRAAWALADRAL